MDYQSQLKLQAWLDGELDECAAREIERRLATDAQGQALLGELKMTRDSLAGAESEVKLPETHEFFWSKVERQIQAAPSQPRETGERSWTAKLLSFLLPATAAAAIAMVAFFISSGRTHTGGPVELATSLTDSDAFTYRDYAAGATLVWFTYPAEEDVANPDPSDTIE